MKYESMKARQHATSKRNFFKRDKDEWAWEFCEMGGGTVIL